MGTATLPGIAVRSLQRKKSSRQTAIFNVLLVVSRDLTLDGAAYEDVDASCALRKLLNIHYDEVREIYVEYVDDMGGLGLPIIMAEHEVPLPEHGLQQIQQVQTQMARDMEQKHQRIVELIMAGKPIGWNVLTELSERSIQ